MHNFILNKHAINILINKLPIFVANLILIICNPYKLWEIVCTVNKKGGKITCVMASSAAATAAGSSSFSFSSSAVATQAAVVTMAALTTTAVAAAN